jgi:hypothetical protein
VADAKVEPNTLKMGISSYFRTKKPAGLQADIPETTHTSNRTVNGSVELQPPTPRLISRPSTSNGSSKSSTFMDDIKHEVMVNYLYQQQCSHLWVGDTNGDYEGVLLRKSKNAYMACPPQLGDSQFAAACAALNVQVSHFSLIHCHLLIK